MAEPQGTTQRYWVDDNPALDGTACLGVRVIAKLQHAADSHGWTRFVSLQNQYNRLRRQDERE